MERLCVPLCSMYLVLGLSQKHSYLFGYSLHIIRVIAKHLAFKGFLFEGIHVIFCPLKYNTITKSLIPGKNMLWNLATYRFNLARIFAAPHFGCVRKEPLVWRENFVTRETKTRRCEDARQIDLDMSPNFATCVEFWRMVVARWWIYVTLLCISM